MERKRRIPIAQNESGENQAGWARQVDDASPADEAAGEEAGPGADQPEPDNRRPGGSMSAHEAPAAERQEPAAAEPEVNEAAALAAERDSYLDSLLRLKAEFENYRKRSQRELGEAESRARGRLLVEFLPILDNLGRALDAAEHHEEGKVLDGVRLTHSQFLSLLEREGVSEVSPLGEPFDPELHEAMLTQPSNQPEGIVTVVLERGYRMGDRVLRPARVAVSSGPAGSGDGAADAGRG